MLFSRRRYTVLINKYKTEQKQNENSTVAGKDVETDKNSDQLLCFWLVCVFVCFLNTISVVYSQVHLINEWKTFGSFYIYYQKTTQLTRLDSGLSWQ